MKERHFSFYYKKVEVSIMCGKSLCASSAVKEPRIGFEVTALTMIVAFRVLVTIMQNSLNSIIYLLEIA